MSTLKPIINPIVLSTTFVQKTPGQMGYSRVDNPTRLGLEQELADLEGAKHALAFSSGSSVLAAVFALLHSGDTILCHREVYEGTVRMLHTIFNRFGIKTIVSDLRSSQSLTFPKGTKMIMCEIVSNPTLSVIDLGLVTKATKKQNAIIVIDNTMATPFFSRPLEKGTDIVVHSLSKFISGHHDVTAGALMTNNTELFKKLRSIQTTLGLSLSPADSFLVSRGIRTFDIRMKKHSENAVVVSKFLKRHPLVEKISFPGISGMVSFWVKGNKQETVRVLKALRHIRIAHSFGGTETTVLHPRSMMTWSISPRKLDKQGITENLVRMSIGLEDTDKIIKDLMAALKKL